MGYITTRIANFKLQLERQRRKAKYWVKSLLNRKGFWRTRMSQRKWTPNMPVLKVSHSPATSWAACLAPWSQASLHFMLLAKVRIHIDASSDPELLLMKQMIVIRAQKLVRRCYWRGWRWEKWSRSSGTPIMAMCVCARCVYVWPQFVWARARAYVCVCVSICVCVFSR